MAPAVAVTSAPIRSGARAAVASQRREAVEAVIDAMSERLDQPFLLEDMARIAYLSPYHFNRIFRSVTGVPPRRFQMALRMRAAKGLLLTTDLSVTEICFDLGYHSLGTFTTHFTELVGVSPRQLRRLAGERMFQALAVTGGACDGTAYSASVTGSITAPDDEQRVVLVGLFADRGPQGVPAGCVVRAQAGPYRIAAVPPGCHYVAAAAFPVSDDPRTYLLPDEESVLVAAADAAVLAAARTTAVRDLHLRPMRSTDPPILLAPHALLVPRADDVDRAVA